MPPFIRQFVSIAILTAFLTTSVKAPAYAQVPQREMMPSLPVPGIMVHLSPEFTPAYLLGLTIHPENPLQFDFLIHKSDQDLEGEQKKQEYKKLVKYFLASLTIPDEDQWVNLSPYEKDRIIKDDFGKTEMGRDLLAQDYILKQITSSMIYPEGGLGKKFWDRVYERAWTEYHTSQVPVDTFNKVWIVPDKAVVYESGNSAFVLQSHLKVMLEEDYLSLEKHSGVTANVAIDKTHSIGSQVIREIILPELEKEVNEGKNFANLRQMFSGMILATWYKKALKESVLGMVYADKDKVKGVDQNPQNNEVIYKRYLMAFKKGVFNYIKEDVDKYTNQEIPRKYFSGGSTMKDLPKIEQVLQGNLPPGMVDPVAFANAAQKADLAKIVLNSTQDTVNALPRNAAMGTGKTIFLIDDEEMIMTLNEAVLVRQGFTILKALTPQEAETIWAANKDKIDLIISDTNRPGGYWTTEVRKFMAERKVPVLAVSGYEGPQAWVGITEHFLGKPYRAEALIAKVKELLPPDLAMKVGITESKALSWEGKINEILNSHQIFITVRYSNTFTKDAGFQIQEMGGEVPGQVHLLITMHPNASLTTLMEELSSRSLDKGLTETDLDKWKNIHDHPWTDSQVKPFNLAILEKSIKKMPAADVARRMGWLETKAVNGDFVAFDPQSKITFTAGQIVFALFKRLNGIDWEYRDAKKQYQFIDFDFNNIPDMNAPATIFAVSLLGHKAISREEYQRLLGDENGFLPLDQQDLLKKTSGPGIKANVARIVHNTLVRTGLKAGLIIPRDKAQSANANLYGGIDFNAANFGLQIKRDGRGMPLPWARQDMAQLARVQGFTPQIIEIRPATNVPIINELQQKLQSP